MADVFVGRILSGASTCRNGSSCRISVNEPTAHVPLHVERRSRNYLWAFGNNIQLRDLEKSLGVKLFRKAGRGLALTEMGIAVQLYANDIFATGQELLDMVNGRPVGGPMILRVGIKDVMPKLVAYQLLQPTLRMSGDVRLLCYEGDVTKLISDLAIHKLDVVLSDTPIDPTIKVRVYSHLLGESEVVFVGTKALAKQIKTGFPRSLDGAPVLLPMRNSVLRRSLDYWFEVNEVRPKICKSRTIV